ncbi:hypothetical protein ACFXOS_25155 [Streptomyces sp. NPDC059175]|uniref:hypothetical protein n=1 Tax=Streptomyces sp. NPDC059175 TaxID=3346757 RepID=UPI00369FEAEA
MTHSGQGDESRHSAATPAREGVVLPADGSGPWAPGVGGDQGAPAGGTPWGAPWGPASAAQPLPPQQAHGGAVPQPYLGAPVAQPPAAGGQMAPQAFADSDATQYIPPVPQGAGALPPESPAESTHFLGTGPVAAAGDGPGAGRPIGDADATQYIPPVPTPHGTEQPVPVPPPGAPYGIRPGAPGDRQPPADFDNLFRSEGAPGAPAGATQQLPRVPAEPHPGPGRQQGQYQPPQQYAPPAAHQQPHEPAPSRSSRVPVIAAVVVGCAVVGLGASALMFGGGDDEGRNDNTTVAVATSPAADATTQAAVDPVKVQAEALDKLLADSNDSRSSVIRSVESIKSCENLDQAATDLRGAAEQRRELVPRLEGMAVDKLPNNQALTAALKKAWEASAAADDHYAEWAGQVKGKKGCRGDKARTTSQTAQANRSSGEATLAKREASGLWNTIAEKYGLTKRGATEL